MFGSGQGMSIFATLMAEDKMSGVFARAAGASQTLGQKLKSTIGMGAAMQVGMSAVNSAMNLMSSSIDGAISRYDALERFPKVLTNLGIEADKAAEVEEILNDRLSGLPTTLDSATGGISRLVAKNGDLEKSTDLFLAMNDAIIAGGGTAEQQASALEQLTQAYSKGKPDMMEWRNLMTAMPGQLTQVAKAMGMTADELGEGLRKGDVSMDDFMKTIVKLDKEGANGFKSFADQAQDAVGGIQTSITVFKTAIVRGIAKSFEAIDDSLKASELPTMAGIVKLATDKVNAAFNSVIDVISKIDFAGIANAAKTYYDTIAPILSGIGKLVKGLSVFLAEHAGTLAAVLPAIMMTVAGFRAMTIIGTVAPGIMAVSKALLILAKDKALSLLPAKLTTTATGMGQTGAAGAAAAPNLAKMGAAVLMVGAGVFLAAAGLAIMALAAVKLAGAGWPAVAVMAGMVAAMAALAYGASLIAVPLAAAGAAFIMLGAGILLAGGGMALIAVGIAQLAKGLPTIAQYGGSAASALLKLAPAVLALRAAGNASEALVKAASAIKMISSSAGSMASGLAKAGASMMLVQKSAANFASTIKAGMTSAKSSVTSGMSAISSVMQKGATTAYRNGANISKGFARGINSQMASVTAAANRMVQAAEKATRAKAQIHSPSRLFSGLGEYVSEGFAVGIESSAKMVAKAARDMVSVPKVGTGSQGMALNGDYNYGNAFVVEVPLNINGREFAKATATDIHDEVNKVQTRSNRKLGYV